MVKIIVIYGSIGYRLNGKKVMLNKGDVADVPERIVKVTDPRFIKVITDTPTPIIVAEPVKIEVPTVLLEETKPVESAATVEPAKPVTKWSKKKTESTTV